MFSGRFVSSCQSSHGVVLDQLEEVEAPGLAARRGLRRRLQGWRRRRAARIAGTPRVAVPLRRLEPVARRRAPANTCRAPVLSSGEALVPRLGVAVLAAGAHLHAAFPRVESVRWSTGSRSSHPRDTSDVSAIGPLRSVMRRKPFAHFTCPRTLLPPPSPNGSRLRIEVIAAGSAQRDVPLEQRIARVEDVPRLHVVRVEPAQLRLLVHVRRMRDVRAERDVVARVTARRSSRDDPGA
jgi:hypothetical protein